MQKRASPLGRVCSAELLMSSSMFTCCVGDDIHMSLRRGARSKRDKAFPVCELIGHSSVYTLAESTTVCIYKEG